MRFASRFKVRRCPYATRMIAEAGNLTSERLLAQGGGQSGVMEWWSEGVMDGWISGLMDGVRGELGFSGTAVGVHQYPSLPRSNTPSPHSPLPRVLVAACNG